ncbi:MAB_1171c family putative transporter [Streptomyces sp. NBC_00091]|uniref:MAB_1171c family putative transporter n=1 Tax=Streptomyces sp. NBC_00091 TaxID=2975648 RepID=UPI0022553429|nr:MAB_1171c family putative transporter [Streptomyces sp. NBC_00091]MCX5380393.1 hypothetical protein [Streptomyces sp. NBC_00091]
MSDLFYYVPVVLLCLAFALRVPELLRHWRDPLVRSVSVLLPLGAAVFFFAAPPTIVQVNELTGIANFSAPFVFGIVTAGSAALINLTITWRGGPESRRRTATRWCVGVYGAVIAVMLTLFALGDAPDERLRDFDTYYATTAYLWEMIVLYILAHTVATFILACLCWQWSREVTGLLRGGLILIVVGSVLNLGYSACKSLAIAARWAGGNWDAVSTTVAPTVAALASLCQCLGLALPSVGQALQTLWVRWSQYRSLKPLWMVMRAVTPYEPVRIPWWSSLGRRHLRRTCDIRDGLRLFAPYLDGDTGRPRAAHEPGPGVLKPESAAYIAMVIDAFAGLRGADAGLAGGSLATVLEGDADQLVRLSGALPPLPVPPGETPRRSGPSPVPATRAPGGPGAQ